MRILHRSMRPHKVLHTWKRRQLVQLFHEQQSRLMFPTTEPFVQQKMDEWQEHVLLHPLAEMQQRDLGGGLPFDSNPPRRLCTFRENSNCSSWNEFSYNENSRIPFKIGNEMIIILGTNFDDFRKKLITVLCSFCSIHVYHEFLYNLHEILFGHLQSKPHD